MKKHLIIDNRMRTIEKEKLKQMGYTTIEVPKNEDLYFEISSHVDIFCAKIKNTIVVEKSIYELLSGFKENIILGENKVKNLYPNDILYNACNVGDFVIHNFKYTDKKILDVIDKYNLKKIDIKQGYSKCSIAVIDENSVIVTDKAISTKLEENGIKTLIIEESNEIKLLDKENNYSKMTGFIGGMISKLGDNIFITGDLTKIDNENKIRDFIESRNLNIIDFPGLDLVDYGGVLEI